jgi:hypothetical protein
MHIDTEKFQLPDGSLPEWVKEFDRCAPWIAAALEYSGGTHTLDDIAEGVARGLFQFWPGRTSVIITEIITYPRLRACHYFLVGGTLEELALMRPEIEAWAKQLGCSRMTTAGRRGWLRTFLKDEGYTERWVTQVKDI